jgi:hypothetical protein
VKSVTADRIAHPDDMRMARDMAAMLQRDGFRVAVVPIIFSHSFAPRRKDVR